MPDGAAGCPAAVAGDGRYVLPAPLPPEPGESLCGLVLRNAAEYRFQDARRLLARIRPPPHVTLPTLCDCDPASEFGTGLRCLLGLPPDTFRRMSPWTGDATSQAILGHSVWQELARPALRAVCPLCLRNSAHHRAVWFIDAVPLCAIHGVWLRTACHACGAPLTWTARGVHLCSRHPRCAADLRDAPAASAPAAHVGAAAALHAALHGGGAVLSALPGMGPGDALKLAFLLGQAALGFERDARPPGFINRHRERLPELMAAGWAALDRWPDGFRRMLDGLRERASDRAGKAGFRKAFGTLSAKVYQWARAEAWGPALGQAFAGYAAEQNDLATTARVVRQYPPGPRSGTGSSP
jgi:hypothetical protein